MGFRRFLVQALGIRLGYRLHKLLDRYDAADVLGAEPRPVPEDLLLEDNVSVLHPDGSLTSYFHIVTRVAEPRILDEWEHHTYSTPTSEGKISIAEARVFSPDGEVTPARTRRAPRPTPDGRPGEVVEVLMLGLVPGCVIELEVQFDWYGPGPYGPHVFGEIFMETTAPCRLRRYAVAVPQGQALNVKLHRYEGEPRVTSVGAYELHVFEERNARGRLADPFTPAARDELPTVEISTLDDWSTLVNDYLEQLAPASAPRLAAEALCDDPPEDPFERARWAYEFVSREVRYGRHPDFLASLAARTPADTVTELRGDCKDKVTLLSHLLEDAGFRTHYVLVEAKTASRRPFLPAPRFDHTILLAERDGKQLWLEPTPGRVDFDYVPAHLQGNPGLVLDTDDPRQIELPTFDLERNADRVTTIGVLDDDGNMKLEMSSRQTGDYAHEVRDFFAALDEDQRLEFISTRLAERFPGVHVDSLAYEDVEHLDRAVGEKLELSLPRWSREAGHFRLVRLPWQFVASSAPVGQAKRDRGLRMGNRRREEEAVEITLPSGWTLAGGAVHVTREVAAARYDLEVLAENGRVRATRRYEVLEREVRPESYAELKEFLEEVARDDQRDLVFEVAELS